MIIEFSVGNFRSIKDTQTISFVATPIVSKYKEVDESNTFQATEKMRLLRSLAIYGANASGKSNFISALTTFLNVVQKSVKNEGVLAQFIMPFLLSDDTINEPSFFEIVFILENTTYRYGFEVTITEVVSEWLFSKQHDKTNRESFIFTREKQEFEINEKSLKSIRKFKNLISNDNPVFRKNSLFLTTLAAFNEDLSKNILHYFGLCGTLTGLGDRFLRQTADEIISKNEIVKGEVLRMLQESDTNIVDIKVNEPSELDWDVERAINYNNMVQAGDKKIITTYHKRNGKNDEIAMLYLDLHGSEGTKRMYEMYPYISLTLKHGGAMIVDEFDARLHPRLSKKIIELFNNPKTNPKNAQILVVTHDTNLLNARTFRRDQILFVEKNKNEESHIYSLAEFKGVRNDASFEKDYLDGRYGAVPFLNNFSSIFEN